MNMQCIVVTPEVSHAPMSSLKDAAATTLSWPLTLHKTTRHVRHPDVAHVEMWPYVASAADWSANQAATAVLMLSSSIT